MRLPVLLAALLVSAGGLAGCFGSEDDPAQPAATGSDPNGVGTGTGADDLVSPINVLAPLTTAITTTSATWVAPGSSIDVAAAAPAKAKGAVSYTWAIGPLPGTVAVTPKADTGSKSPSDYIQPGQSDAIKYTEAGVYNMHCHPHPKMKHNVTVIEGYSTKAVEVLIVDGDKTEDRRFVPADIVVGVGTTVTYKNVGKEAHSATAEAQEPPLKALDLKAASGQVTVSGSGWQRILVVVKDNEGRFGSAQHDIYVSDIPTFPTQSEEFEFEVGTPAQADEQRPPKTAGVTLAQGGRIFMNWTVTDALAPTGQSPATAELHLTKQGEAQDTLTGDGATGAQSTTGPGGVYTLSVQARQGANVVVAVTIDVVYDLVPPPPAMASAGGDGHGEHAGH